ncbi:MAG: hypothetical protein K0S65_3171 [Labilithrix sp.]|nr:hypothetical protein [Labilithrix sp.]
MLAQSTRDSSVARALRMLVPFIFVLGGGLASLGPSACDSSPVAPSGATADSGAIDCDAGEAEHEPDDRPDAEADDRSRGSYRQGVNLCCGEGKGLTCCPPEMLPDSDAGRVSTCFQYGGVRGKCQAHGEHVEAKDICSTCCEGLTRTENLRMVPGGPIRVGNAECEPTAGASVFFCLPCGNGTCDDGEDPCNCPSDCPL